MYFTLFSGVCERERKQKTFNLEAKTVYYHRESRNQGKIIMVIPRASFPLEQCGEFQLVTVHVFTVCYRL